MHKKLTAISFILIFIFVSAVKGQKMINSPYSRFNIGTLDPSGSFRSQSMGGTGVAMRDNSSISFVNPASYSSFDTTSFLFDFGLDYSIIDLAGGKTKYRSDDMNFDHIMIGFPISKGWGFAAGLVPVSNGFYKLSETILPGDTDYDPNIGEVTSSHIGTGGFSNFFLGSGINITKNFSAGVNLSVLFGQLERTNQFEFKDYANTFGQFTSERLKINGINIDYGLQYIGKLKNDYFLTAGISVTAAKKYKSDFEKIAERYASYSVSGYSPDTLFYTKSSSKDSTKLPTSIRFGVSFGKRDKFVAAVDYVYTNWASSRIHGSNGYLANSQSLLLGVEYIPEKYSNTSFMSRIEYRIGGHISNNYLLTKYYNNTGDLVNGRILEYGASCGFALRLRNSFSKTNVFFDFTRKTGEHASGLHRENYYNIGVSLNFYDFWFLKRKID